MRFLARSQVKKSEQRHQQAQAALQREREKVKEALLGSRNMAEMSMQFSGEQEERLLNKVQKHVQVRPSVSNLQAADVFPPQKHCAPQALWAFTHARAHRASPAAGLLG